MGELFRFSEFTPIRRKPVLQYWPGKIVDTLYEDKRGVLAEYNAKVWAVLPFLDASEKDLKCLTQRGPAGRKEWYIPVDLVRKPRKYTRMLKQPLLHEEGIIPFGEVKLPWLRN